MPRKFGNSSYSNNLYGYEQTRPIEVQIYSPIKGQKFDFSETNVKITGSVRDSELRFGIEKVELLIKRVKTITSEIEYWNGSGWQATSTWVNLGGPSNATAEIWEWETSTISFGSIPAKYNVWAKATDTTGTNTTVNGVDYYSFFTHSTPVPTVSINTISNPLDCQTMLIDGFVLSGTTLGGNVPIHSTRETVDRFYIRIDEKKWTRLTTAQIVQNSPGDYNWQYKWNTHRDGDVKIEFYCVSKSGVKSEVVEAIAMVQDAIIPSLSVNKMEPDYINQGVKVVFDASDNLGIVKYMVKEISYPYVKPASDDPDWINIQHQKTLKREVKVIFE